MKLLIKYFFSISVLIVLSTPAFAVSSFLDKWREVYPNSQSGDIKCQLCHVAREGGSPWNAYGRQIRNTFLDLDANTRTIEQAFAMVEPLNADSDTQQTSNLSEINANTQPGWKPGQNNLAYDRFDQVVGLFFPPVTVDPYPVSLPIRNSNFELDLIADGFTSPLAGVTAPGMQNASLLFVADQVGLVWRLNLTNGAKSIFLDLQSRLVPLGAFNAGGYDERGLLGFAFHPDFLSNGKVYSYTSQPVGPLPDFSTLSVSDTANHQSVVTEHTLNTNGLQSGEAQILSERELIRFDQPQFNHNGGDLKFDAAGFLYIGVGDGGGADDQGVGHGADGNGADPSNPFGAILRIDPTGDNSANGQYGIPLDNPFVDDADRLDEIYAYGLRNPWKMSFDNNGDLYATDVGQNDIEEVNLIQAGEHYGWRFREGSFFFDPNGDQSGLVTKEFPDNLPSQALVDPIFEYDHDEGISISAGQVYRGRELPSLGGKMLIADFQKRFFIGDLETKALTALDLNPDIFIYSVAIDSNNELYIMGNTTAQTSGATGKVYKLKASNADEFCFPIRTRSGAIAVPCL